METGAGKPTNGNSEQTNELKDDLSKNQDSLEDVSSTDITKHPSYEETISKVKMDAIREQERQIKARILQKEAKVKSFDELQKYVRLGKEAESIATKNKKDQSTDNQESNKNDLTIDIKSIIAEKEEALNKANQERETYKNRVLQNSLQLAYLESGGIPNDPKDDGLKAQDIAISQLMNSDMFEVDEDFNVTTKAGIDIKKSVELWLKQNHIFKKSDAIQTPSALPNKSNSGTLTSNMVTDSINKFFQN